MKLFVALLLMVVAIGGCGRSVKVPLPSDNPAYRVTRQDGMIFIMEFPRKSEGKTLDDLRKAAGCQVQVCMVEVIRLLPTTKKRK